MLKKIILCLLITSSSLIFSQSSSRDIANNQYAMMYYLNKDVQNFGANGTEELGSKFFADRNSNNIYFKAYFKQYKKIVKGKTYYNMKFYARIKMRDVNSVYEKGNKLVLRLNSNGYEMRFKAPKESWTKFFNYKNNFYITITDDEVRRATLERVEFLVKHPKFLEKYFDLDK
jgi:hypothetical protein